MASWQCPEKQLNVALLSEATKATADLHLQTHIK